MAHADPGPVDRAMPDPGVPVPESFERLPAERVIVVGQAEAPMTVVPRGLSVSLGEEQFEAVSAVNVEDLMKYAPNFYVRKRFAGDDNAVVALRGANTIQSARTIVLVDGFLVSNFLGNRWDFPPKWNVVGPNEVQQFDIVYGPYSARYGGHSMGGVVSITTDAPEVSEAFLSAQSFVMPFQEYGIDETFAGGSVEGGLSWAPAGSPLRLRAGFRRFESTGQSMTYTLLSPTSAPGAASEATGAFPDPSQSGPIFGALSPPDVTQTQLRIRASLDLSDAWRLEALAFAWDTQQTLSDARTFLRTSSGEPVGQGRVRFDGRVWTANGLTLSRFDRLEYLAGLRLAGEAGGWDLSANLSRYWIADWETRSSSGWNTGLSNGAGTQQVQDEPGWWVLDAGVERALGAHTLAVGLNANLYETGQDTFAVSSWRTAGAPVFSSATAGKTRTWGVYAEDAIDVSDRVSVTVGVRYDSWKAFDGSISRKPLTGARIDALYPERTRSSLSPKLSVEGAVTETLSAQLSLGTAVRFPTVGELFQGRIDEITQQIDPNSFDPQLRPEVSTDMNLIVRQDLPTGRLTASVFAQDVEDAVFSFQGLNAFGNVVSSYKNVDRVRQYGVELIAELEDVAIEGLDLDLNAAWMDARTIRNSAAPAAEGKMFPRIPEWRVSGSARYDIAPTLVASLGWRYASRPNSDLFGLVRGDAYGYQSEYLFLDARLNWDASKAVRFSFGVDNLNNDKAYVAHPLPQRTFILEARWRR
jgi:iron complex outermembrane receptor protein